MLLQAAGQTVGDLSPGYAYLAGRPMVAGPYSFTLQVTDSANHTAAKAFSVQVAALDILYSSLPINSAAVSNPFILGQAITAQPILVIGGSGTYSSWTLPQPLPGFTTGEIYPGLTMNAVNGIITGTPANTGGLTQAVLVLADSNGNTVTQNVSVTAVSGTATATVTLGGPSAGTVVALGGTNTYTITPSGGTGPYTITPVGALPACASNVLLLNGASLTPGFAAGTDEMQTHFEQAGPCVFTLQATDSSLPANIGARTYSFPDSDRFQHCSDYGSAQRLGRHRLFAAALFIWRQQPSVDTGGWFGFAAGQPRFCYFFLGTTDGHADSGRHL